MLELRRGFFFIAFSVAVGSYTEPTGEDHDCMKTPLDAMMTQYGHDRHYSLTTASPNSPSIGSATISSSIL